MRFPDEDKRPLRTTYKCCVYECQYCVRRYAFCNCDYQCAYITDDPFRVNGGDGGELSFRFAVSGLALHVGQGIYTEAKRSASPFSRQRRRPTAGSDSEALRPGQGRAGRTRAGLLLRLRGRPQATRGLPTLPRPTHDR